MEREEAALCVYYAKKVNPPPYPRVHDLHDFIVCDLNVVVVGFKNFIDLE